MEKRDQSRLFLRQNRQKSAKQKNPSVTGHVFPNRQDFFFEKLVCVRNFEGGFFVKKKRKIPRPDRRGAACRSRKSVPVTLSWRDPKRDVRQTCKRYGELIWINPI
jgi:hypothetical protein